MAWCCWTTHNGLHGFCCCYCFIGFCFGIFVILCFCLFDFCVLFYFPFGEKEHELGWVEGRERIWEEMKEGKIWLKYIVGKAINKKMHLHWTFVNFSLKNTTIFKVDFGTKILNFLNFNFWILYFLVVKTKKIVLFWFGCGFSVIGCFVCMWQFWIGTWPTNTYYPLMFTSYKVLCSVKCTFNWLSVTMKYSDCEQEEIPCSCGYLFL